MDDSRREEHGDLTGWICHFLANQNLPKGAKPRTPKECSPWKAKAESGRKVVKVSPTKFIEAMAGKKR